MNDQLKMRGSLFAALRGYVQQQPDVYKSILSKADPEVTEVFESVLVYKDFYPIRLFQEFLRVYYQRVGQEAFLDSATYLAKRDLKGLFLVFARLLSREFLIKKMGTLWNKLFTGGEISLIESTDSSISVKVADVPLSDEHRIHVERYMKTLLEMATKRPHTSQSNRLDQSSYQFSFAQDSRNNS